MLREIVKQLELCEYECEGGLLVNNKSFVELKELADQEGVIVDASLIGLILVGYDQYLADCKDWDERALAKGYVEAKQREGKITDHIRYATMEMSSAYMLIVYKDINDNQYFANDGLRPDKIEKVGQSGSIVYMLIKR